MRRWRNRELELPARSGRGPVCERLQGTMTPTDPPGSRCTVSGCQNKATCRLWWPWFRVPNDSGNAVCDACRGNSFQAHRDIGGRPPLVGPLERLSPPSNVGCDHCCGSESDHELGCPRTPPTPGEKGGGLVSWVDYRERVACAPRRIDPRRSDRPRISARVSSADGRGWSYVHRVACAP